MGKGQGSEVRVFRLGRAQEPEALERVRWGYAVFVPEESLGQFAALLHGGEASAEEIGALLAAIPEGAIQGVDAVRKASQQDPQLRRALRDARQALRKGSNPEDAK